MKFNFMIGVLEGYGHENKGLTIEKQYELGKNAYMEAKNIEDEGEIDVTIQPAAAVYLQDWGCPVGGEGGVQITGEADSVEEVEAIVQKMMPILGQSTCTIEFEDDDGHSLGSSYVKNQGTEVDRNDPVNAERFSVKIPVEDVLSMQVLGERLQTSLQVVGGKTGIYATGILTEGYDETTNTRYYEYRGSQNPMFIKDSEAYMDSAYQAISVALSGLNHQYEVDFNEFGVITPRIDMERDEKEIRPVEDLER